MDVGEWLRGLGLGQYERLFHDNAVDAEVLPELTESDLEKLAIPLGHRKRLIKAIVGLGVAAAAPPGVASQPDAGGAERRQLTVMFCDLVGSTALSARLDPEDMRAIIGAYHRCAAQAIEHAGGFVAKYMGDGVLAYFGYPHAHENDAERAVQAGLALVAEAPRLPTAAEMPLRVRVGIATGLVVVGDLVGTGDAQERGVVGDTPNLAARLQAIAEPGTVVIAESTRRLLGDLFELADLGAHDLKGIAGPVQAWAALRTRSIESRFEALHAAALPALVGREEEAGMLDRRWSKAAAGEGQVVLLSGEAGIGKSRLTAALMDRLSGTPHTRLRYFCSPQHTDSVLHPVIGQIERAAGLTHDDPPVARLDKLDALLLRTATSGEDRALIAALLSLPEDERYPVLQLAPQQRRQRTLQALVGQMEALTRQNPILMIFEDAHWTDPTSLELFGRIVDRIATLRGLLVVTYRPEFAPPWIGRPHVTALTLNRLARPDADAIIDRIAGDRPLPAGIRQDIIERTDGIPLFVEEMTKAVLEAQSENEARRTAAAVPSPALAVPASLHASLMARLDRLGAAKEVVQIGAALGREFPHAMLAAVSRKSESELGAALDRLVQAGLVSRQGMPPHASYLFKHALVQDAAYGLLLREPRRALHARIAQALESLFPDIAASEPETLAYHFGRADLAGPACAHFERAGDRAAARSAYAEAVAHFNAALAQASGLPPGPERDERELAVLLKQGPAVVIVKGMRSDAIEDIYQRACGLARTGGDEKRLFKALWGLWFSATLGGRPTIAGDRAEELVTLGERSRDDALLLEGLHCRWATGFFRGAVAHTIADTREGLKLYDPQRHGRLGAEYGGHDPGVCAHGACGLALAQFGKPGEAAESIERGIALSRALDQPSSITFAIMNALTTFQMIDDRESVARFAAQMSEIADKFNLPAQRSIAAFMSSWAGAEGDRLADGLAAMEAEFARVSTASPIPLFHTGVLAGTHLAAGQVARALELLDGGLKRVQEPGVGFYLPEIHRLRGECLLALDPAIIDAAERSFADAIAIAKHQQARVFQLAAASARARAWTDAGRAGHGIGALREVVSAFGEGDDAPQLAAARQFLAAQAR